VKVYQTDTHNETEEYYGRGEWEYEIYVRAGWEKAIQMYMNLFIIMVGESEAT